MNNKYSELSDRIADEIINYMMRRDLDSTNYETVSKALEYFESFNAIRWMEQTGEQIIWWIEEDPNTTFKVIINMA